MVRDARRSREYFHWITYTPYQFSRDHSSTVTGNNPLCISHLEEEVPESGRGIVSCSSGDLDVVDKRSDHLGALKKLLLVLSNLLGGFWLSDTAHELLECLHVLKDEFGIRVVVESFLTSDKYCGWICFVGLVARITRVCSLDVETGVGFWKEMSRYRLD